MPTITQKGQVTIPRQFRKFLNINQGDQVDFEIENDRLVVRKGQKSAQFKRYVGFLKNKKDKTVDKIVDELRSIE